MAERRLHGLQRVLGVNALFSTAYGNVGSSIYYALGLVASFALGLTPVVFVITGFIFYLTAATYAEATAMYPEAGGSSSFARHAFNELVAFIAKGLVADPSAVRVNVVEGGRMLELETAPDDRGRVIGRQGRVAKAMRAVLEASRHGRDVRLEIVD